MCHHVKMNCCLFSLTSSSLTVACKGLLQELLTSPCFLLKSRSLTLFYFSASQVLSSCRNEGLWVFSPLFGFQHMFKCNLYTLHISRHLFSLSISVGFWWLEPMSALVFSCSYRTLVLYLSRVCGCLFPSPPKCRELERLFSSLRP